MQKELKSLKVVFMGTPEFAVASLDKLHNAGINIIAVITAPDKRAGRGMHLQQSPVKQYAVEKNIPVLQPVKLKDPDFINQLRSLEADIQVIVAFRMLPEVVWNMPSMGTINVHGSLLPQYRGAAPINWAVINGEKYTGVTTFKLQHEIDTGNILMSEKIEIGDDEDAGSLHDRMKLTGAELLLKTLEGITNNTLTDRPQSELTDSSVTIKHAPKIFTETCRIDWNQTMEKVHNLIRGLSPSPGAFTFLEGKSLKVYKVQKSPEPLHHAPGDFHTDKKTFLRFACTDGYIEILQLQLQGKKQLSVQDFLRGYHFTS